MDELIDYAMHWIGTPYKYGGNNPMQGGFDCSGYICTVLRYAGLVGHKEDLTAQQLYDKFELSGSMGSRVRGALAFYGGSVKQISHVALMTSPYQIYEAGGGDHTTTTIEEAAKRNAMVRGMLLEYRKDLVATIKPRYAAIGLI